MLSHAAILERVIDPQRGDFPPELARRVLKFAFPPEDHARYHELSAKAQDGALSTDERAELEDYLNVNDLLMMLKAKAEASLEVEVRETVSAHQLPCSSPPDDEITSFRHQRR